jgi:hypothetical protein
MEKLASEKLERVRPQTTTGRKWKGPYCRLLMTHITLKLAGAKPWVHHLESEEMPSRGKCTTTRTPASGRASH